MNKHLDETAVVLMSDECAHCSWIKHELKGDFLVDKRSTYQYAELARVDDSLFLPCNKASMHAEQRWTDPCSGRRTSQWHNALLQGLPSENNL